MKRRELNGALVNAGLSEGAEEQVPAYLVMTNEFLFLPHRPYSYTVKPFAMKEKGMPCLGLRRSQFQTRKTTDLSV